MVDEDAQRVAEYVIGMSYKEAVAHAEVDDIEIRLVSVNGVAQEGKSRKNPRRVNVEVDEGWITCAYVG